MDFVTAVRTCLMQKYASFDGYASRSEFWWFALFAWLVSSAADVVDNNFGWQASSGAVGLWHNGDFTLFSSLVSLMLFLPGLSVAARRLRDAGHSPANVLWALVPVLGWIILFVFLTERGVRSAVEQAA